MLTHADCHLNLPYLNYHNGLPLFKDLYFHFESVLCSIYVPGICGSQKTLSGPLELELQAAMSCLVGAGN